MCLSYATRMASGGGVACRGRELNSNYLALQSWQLTVHLHVVDVTMKESLISFHIVFQMFKMIE